MYISVLDIFSVGIGPSSSHTMGPMRAMWQFVNGLSSIEKVSSVVIDLYGSLAMTGEGHGTDKAVILGLMGHLPESLTGKQGKLYFEQVKKEQSLSLLGTHTIAFSDKSILFHKGKSLPYHANGLKVTAYDTQGSVIRSKIYYSVGGGSIVTHEEMEHGGKRNYSDVPFPFETCEELLKHCRAEKMNISEIMLQNELSHHTESELREGIIERFEVMQRCVKTGCETEGMLPGHLGVKRRAPEMYARLLDADGKVGEDPALVMDWVSLFAMAVNEENAAHGQIVIAPTNGAAGIIPAVLHYYRHFCGGLSDDDVVNFFLTASAICILYKRGASISGAEMGCQGEVGVATSMAAGALASLLGGNLSQVENAAEIGMEHNLGLTCDPVGGMVQIPCIERNAMGSIKAINAARLSLLSDSIGKVRLDDVIATMYQTGLDMQTRYKETSEGGLAQFVKCDRTPIPVSLPEC